MFEMAKAGKHVCQVVFLAVFNAVFIAYGAAGLNKRGNTGFVAQFHAIGKGKERIACHYGAVQVEPELVRFFNGMAQRINAARLAATFANQLFVFNQCNGVAF
jgi:hypothetical protein